jgi:hypothetical protein
LVWVVAIVPPLLCVLLGRVINQRSRKSICSEWKYLSPARSTEGWPGASVAGRLGCRAPREGGDRRADVLPAHDEEEELAARAIIDRRRLLDL